jgi:hypothetical protein
VAIPIIVWLLAGFAAGAAVGYFWDEIKEWATRALGYIFDAINWAIEVTSDAITYLVKQGNRIYKRIEVYVRNVYTGATRLEFRQQEISPHELPENIKDQLNTKQKLKLMQSET